jgi:hypothetical protein
MACASKTSKLTVDPSGTHLVGAVVWIEDPG